MTPPIAIWSTDDPPALLASRDTRTNVLRFPPLSAASPLAASHDTVTLPRRGTVYSFSVIHPNPKTGALPFAVGYVDLAGPVRIFGRIAGEGVRIGAECEVAADAQFGYRFTTLAR